jgi:hypothetical protein
MNKKNILYRLYAAAFVGICLVPSVLMPFSKSDSSKEKRKLASAPEITDKDGKLNFDFFKEFDKWFSDHMAFRQQLVNADARLRSTLFKTSANEDVIVGKDGWLYYSATADDFLNINTLSQRGINNICHNLELVKRYCDENGIKFVFTVAPNKNSIYPENMPFNYVESDNAGNYERLAESLAESGFFLDMKKALLETDSSIPLYHKTDTHWNNLGAYAGHVKLMEMLGRESCPAGDSWYTKDDRLGDLAAMLYPAEGAKDTQVYNDYGFTYKYRGRFGGLDDVTIKTVCGGREGSLLMYRDSFGEALLPYMAESYASAEFSRTVPYYIEGKDCDELIIEIVERNLADLQKYAPVMSAPEADISGLEPEEYSGQVSVRRERSGELVHIYGVLPDEFFSGAEAEIYLAVNGKAYEAFNCFECGLLGREDETSDNGFSLYIPAEAAEEGSSLSLIVSSGGKTLKTENIVTEG